MLPCDAYPPLDPPCLLPFQCLRLTAKIWLRRLWCQEDLRFKIFGPPLEGTTGGSWEEGGGPSQTPFRSHLLIHPLPPSPPLLIHPCPSPPPGRPQAEVDSWRSKFEQLQEEAKKNERVAFEKQLATNAEIDAVKTKSVQEKACAPVCHAARALCLRSRALVRGCPTGRLPDWDGAWARRDGFGSLARDGQCPLRGGGGRRRGKEVLCGGGAAWGGAGGAVPRTWGAPMEMKPVHRISPPMPRPNKKGVDATRFEIFGSQNGCRRTWEKRIHL